jgi:microcystin degradation protein MlrC
MAGRFLSDYKEPGLKLMKADIIVVKNLFPFRYRLLLYNRKNMNIITPGLSNINPEELHYQYIPRPIYPLDEVESW